MTCASIDWVSVSFDVVLVAVLALDIYLKAKS